MNPLKLGKAILETYFFMRTLTQKIGEPVQLTEEACRKIFADMKADKLMTHKFAMMVNIKMMKIPFHFNTEKFLPYKGKLELTKFFNLIHLNFAIDYIKWGQAVYAFIIKEQENFEPLDYNYRLTIPLKLKDGQYYWVLQESFLLQKDANNRLVSNLNIYTIIRPMERSEDIEMLGRFYNNGFEIKEWAQSIRQQYFNSPKFELTTQQNAIVTQLHLIPLLNNAQIAELLNTSKDTIDMQNKNMLLRAREAFDNQAFGTVKDVVRFLEDLGYFET